MFDEYVRERLKHGLSAQRILQDLQMEKGFEGSYESVKRYVRKLGNDTELPFRRMEVLPGTECQVDYGTWAWIVGADGKRRKTHLFRGVLSCSRKAYSEVSFTQETECFLRALENAFRHFGGVPETVVIDNLKAARFKNLKPLDRFDWQFNPNLDRRHIHELATCAFIREHTDLLIIDDMGLKQLPARAGEHLFEVIMRRYELRSIDHLHVASMSST